jgi:hypothetical protein
VISRVTGEENVGNMFTAVDKTYVKPISSVRKTFDPYLTPLAPLGVKLSNEEKKLKTGLLDHATGITTEQMSSYEFRKFPASELEQDMVLVAPRKVTAYVHVPIKPEKEKKKRTSTGTSAAASRSAKQARAASRAQEAIQDKFFVKDDTAENGEAVQSAMARRMARTSSTAGGGSGMEGPAEAIFTSTAIRLPKNFYAVISGVFNKFWEMEFDEPSVNQAFFAKIDKANCKEYGLENFSELPMSLSVIRDRVEASKQVDLLGGWDQAAMAGTKESKDALHAAFKSNEDFYSDMLSMYTNIDMYFPPESPAYTKGKELRAIFEKEWAAAKTKFVLK